jgi:hypothetical protein
VHVRDFIQGVLIFFLSITAAICYGILHDQITARICLEYFTVYHPPVFGNVKDPTLLGIGWGVIATWWVGAILGVPLALAARVGRMPKRSAGSMVRPVGVLLMCMAGCAAAAGGVAYAYGSSRGGLLFDPVSSGLPSGKQVPFLVDLWTHLASYASGFLGGMALIGWTLVARYKAEVKLRLGERGAR